MTPEQKREKILKQLLPMLVVMVIYFVFVSSIATNKSETAVKAYASYFQKGISKAALPRLRKEQRRISGEIKELRRKDKKIREDFMKESVFSSPDSGNTTTEIISNILERYQLRLIHEETLDDIDPEQLSKSLRDTQHWLKDVMAMDNSTLKIIKIHFLGSYENAFRALVEISNDQIKALPISLTMRESSGNNNGAVQQMEWVLQLWL